MSEKIIMGIDHGNGNMKTANTIFPCGFTRQSVKPSLLYGSDVIKYKDNYYILSDIKMPYKIDKTTDEDCYILTLFAIAKEAEARNIRLYGKDIILSVGLPPAHLEKTGEKFRNYFMQNARNGVDFEYNEKKFSFHIAKTYTNPQNYAAAVNYSMDVIREYKTVYCIDIGDGTVDLLVLKNGSPEKQTVVSKELGISILREKIIDDVINDYGYTLDSDIIEQVLMKKKTVLPQEIVARIEKETGEWAKLIVNQLHSKVSDFRIAPTIFSGGGTCLLQPYLEESAQFGMARYIDDICANAQGYEKLARVREAHAVG